MPRLRLIMSAEMIRLKTPGRRGGRAVRSVARCVQRRPGFRLSFSAGSVNPAWGAVACLPFTRGTARRRAWSAAVVRICRAMSAGGNCDRHDRGHRDPRQPFYPAFPPPVARPDSRTFVPFLFPERPIVSTTAETLTTESRSSCLQHFMRVAERGRRPGCSGGERRAWKLVKAILADAHGLDGQAIEGAAEFLRATAAHPSAAAEAFGL